MDELERRLRRVLHDDRWALDAPTDALDRVHRGVQRRQRRHRAAAAGLSGAAVVAVVAVAFTLTPVAHQADTGGQAAGAGAASSSRPSASVFEESPRQVPPPGPESKTQSRPSSPTPDVVTTAPGGRVPPGFQAASVTAVSTRTYWVLGTAPCGDPPCTSVVTTTDGGRTFHGLRAPRAPLADGSPSADTVAEVRFANTEDGFAYGGALWSTHDGGDTWDRVPMPGRVVRLEAASGTVWAVLRTGDEYGLYRAPASDDVWSEVHLPVALDGAEPDLALQASTVTVAGASGDRAVTLVSTDGGRTFQVRDRPCAPALTARLSAAADAVWMFCATGTEGQGFVSTDQGLRWHRVNAAPARGWPNSTVIGARSATEATYGSAADLLAVSSDGSTSRVATLDTTGSSTVTFVGYTTPDIGYAVLSSSGTGSLWRTTDGGQTWSVVRYR